ncbi:hypothetical protein [Actinokineospora sp. NBRC 105648]|uniref:hypothetical protein n=1 Tax=Actinokineospora sp. NBRC 105648 TaxID=3032206 RepID=UPI0024A2C36C|nr:hypothetical protein [Actinokineospora sp. NBRC 105648]GLZ43413.1 hypothetical protein Acsp05_70370 [Actinokineospora sp. NBRC 105648]
MRKSLVRGVLALSVAVLGVVGYAGYAMADPSPVDGAVSAADTAKAQAAATAPDVTATVGKFLGQANTARSGVASADVQASVGGTSVAVYELNADFVAGRSPKAGRFSYVAVPAKGADGSAASVWTVKDQAGNWQVANIAAGDIEFAQATKLTAGAVLLREPQTNTWYALTGNNVRALATGKTMTLSQYQHDVSARYGDKLPGSAYDRKGTAGGFSSPSTGLMSPTGAGTTASTGTPWIVIGILVVGVAVVAFAAASPARRRS